MAKFWKQDTFSCWPCSFRRDLREKLSRKMGCFGRQMKWFFLGEQNRIWLRKPCFNLIIQMTTDHEMDQYASLE